MAALSVRHDVIFDRRLWRNLSEDILGQIIKRLPLAARCRFRCVCRKWRGLLSVLPYPCTIMSKLGEGNFRYICHPEDNWDILPDPFRKDPSFGRVGLAGVKWEVADVDAGLVCYLWIAEKRTFWLCVSNPVTNFVQIIPPAFPAYAWEVTPRPPPRLKLHVNEENKSFRIIVVIDDMPETAMYESTTGCWAFYTSSPSLYGDFGFSELFVWNNVFFTYKVEHKDYWDTLILAFDSNSGGWIDVDVEFPCEIGFPTSRFILSDKGQVMLVLFCKENSYFSVWKLLNNGSSDSSPGFSLSRWERVNIEGDRAIQALMGGRHLGQVCYGGDYVCFSFSESKTLDGEHFIFHKFANRWDKCVRYSFASRRYSVIPCLPGRLGQRGFYKLYPWEPNSNADVNNPGTCVGLLQAITAGPQLLRLQFICQGPKFNQGGPRGELQVTELHPLTAVVQAGISKLQDTSKIAFLTDDFKD